MPQTTQLAVIGAGPGGYAAAFYAADLGMQVALIDPSPNPGGVCLFRGCMPSKALLHVAKVLTEAKHAEAWGVTFGSPKIDVGKLRAFKTKVVNQLTGGLGQLTKQRKIKYIQGTASFVDARTLEITPADGTGAAGKELLTFEHAIIAIGSHPTKVPGLWIDSDRLMDSTTALEIPDIPKTLLVIGGGYIGLELGTVYASLGTKVTVVEMTDGLLPGADRDLVNVLARRVDAMCEAVLLNTKVVSMKEQKNGIAVTFESSAPAGANPVTLDKKEQVFDRVLMAVGRRPNQVPGIEKTGVEVNERGFIVVNEARQTSVPHIFAIGDIVGEPMLAHTASHEGRVAVEAIAGQKAAFEPLAIPAVVFTDPELAWAGLTEAEAQKQGREIAVARFPWGASGRSLTLDRTDGLTKLILDPKTERILGVGIVGPGAGELIAEGVLAVEMGANATDLKMSIHPHPTLSETLMEAAEVFYGHSTHVYRPRRKH
jgi:dihydrolipoamide dehydrogenase